MVLCDQSKSKRMPASVCTFASARTRSMYVCNFFVVVVVRRFYYACTWYGGVGIHCCCVICECDFVAAIAAAVYFFRQHLALMPKDFRMYFIEYGLLLLLLRPKSWQRICYDYLFRYTVCFVVLCCCSVFIMYTKCLSAQSQSPFASAALDAVCYAPFSLLSWFTFYFSFDAVCSVDSLSL